MRWWIAGLLLTVAACREDRPIRIIQLTPRDQAPALPPPPPPPPTPTPSPSPAPARDPWSELAPDDLMRMRTRANRREPLDETELEQLRAIARRDSEDPRPLLVLAHALVQRNAWTDALVRYERAFAMDAGIRGDEQMQRDLVRMTRSPIVGDDAVRTLRRIYPRDELAGVLDRAAAAEETRFERDRITSLRDQLLSE